MALLKVNERKAIFQELGLGSYNKTNIKKFQKAYMLRKADWDGIYGYNTDNTLRTVYYVKRYTKNFKPQEFQCECGGRYCCGYPTYMKPSQLIHMQTIRDHYGKPITVTSGLRCKTWNSKCGGSIQNSLHMQGLATDFYQVGVTDTLANRRKAIKYIKKLPNHHYTYGNGINSYGNCISAIYMGNALHTDTNDNVKPVHPTPEPPTPTPEPPTPEPPTPTKQTLVIDVSEFQNSIDFAKAKADGVKGVIVRCGFRGAEKGALAEDARFFEHIKGAYKAGLPVGIYMFTQAITAEEGKEEADYAIRLWEQAGIPLSYPIAIDTENVFYKDGSSSKAGRANGISTEKRTEAIKGFCEEIKAKGYEPMIYASTSWLNTKLDMSKLPYKVWVAQYAKECEYKGDYVMWQYTSSGKVNGINGNVDMNHCYMTPSPYSPSKPSEQGYSGKMPTLTIQKTNAEAKRDAVRFAKWIAEDNRFHYGHGKHAHHNGCFFCGTQPKSKKNSGIKEWETTYCCNPFANACLAHGGCIPQALKLCQSGRSFAFDVGKGYDASPIFTKLGKPKKSTLQAGDIFCNGHHVAIYLGDGKLAEAGSEDNNKVRSASWNNSIHITSLTDKKYKSFQRVYRYNASVNNVIDIRHGEVSDRVKDLQNFLIWYGYNINADGIFGDSTLEAVKKMQKMLGLKADGVVGKSTLDAMAKAVK